MASSSLCSHSEPASSSRSCKYDLFLSFRGEDTRKTFVDHLYSALEQHLIRVYKDDKALPRGDSIDRSLFEAIEESQIAIIIFSKNYADSSWCLEELAHIMNCRNEQELIVIPIFYDVEPTQVRNQKGKFGEAFAKQRAKNVAKAEIWRKALVDVSNIAGWEPKNIADGHEAQFIKKIVDTILDRLFDLSSCVCEDLVGMRTRLQDLESLLDIGSGGVCMVGIWGVGGGGKTTLATSIYMEISQHFQGHCIVENVREETCKNGVNKLQENILSALLKKEVKVHSVVEGKHMMKSMLCRRKVLVVLDDVDKLGQLEALAGKHNWFGSGSRIIITTRDEHLLRTHKVDHIYPVTLLSNDEAIQLFRKHAYNEDDPIEDYDTLSLRVVSYAFGLPLALKVLGSFLYDKNKNEWISALDKLKDIPDLEVMNILKVSYDGLETNQKALFLDIACFWRFHSPEDVMEILEACGYHPEIGIKVLRQKALIMIRDDGTFDMHDLVQEMGLYIVRGEHPNNPEKHSRLWKAKEIIYIPFWDETMEYDKVESIKYEYDYMFNYDDSLCLHETTIEEHDQAITCESDYKYHCRDLSRLCKIVSKMKKLRLLIVNMHDYCNHDVEEVNFLSNELRYIEWNCYPTSSFPHDFQPTKLVVLKLSWSKQKELWKGYKHLPHLKVLHLESMEKLLRTPDFDGLPCLQKLMIDDCKELEEIHPSLGNHKCLEHLQVSGCCKLERMPTISRMENIKHQSHLKVLHLVSMEKLLSTPDFDGLPCLQTLTIHDCKELEEIHPSLGNHKRLEHLQVSRCCKLKRMPTISQMENSKHLPHLKVLHLFSMEKLLSTPDFDGLPCLQKLTIDDCNELEEIHPSLGNHKRLEYLQVSGCCKLKRMPTISRMENIKVLKIRNCHLKDGGILFGTGELSNLQELDLSGNSFSRLDSLSQLTRLKFLDLTFCNQLVELPELPSNLAILIAHDCKSLTIVEDFNKNCKDLREVLFGDGKSEGLPESMLKGKTAENGSIMYLVLLGVEVAKGFIPPLLRGTRCRLELPENWFNDFSGFLMCIVITDISGFCANGTDVSMKQVSGMHSVDDVLWEENDGAKYMKQVSGMDFEDDMVLEEYCNCAKYSKQMSGMAFEDDVVLEESDSDGDGDGDGDGDSDVYMTKVWYLSFGSLRHTVWWDQTYKALSFEIEDYSTSGFRVRLVEKNSRSGLTEEAAETSSDSSSHNYTPKIIIQEDSASALTISLLPYGSDSDSDSD